MGCDIHMNIEVKTENGWELYSRPNISRSYDLFSKMADVRNDDSIIPISKPKGLPDDISFLVKKSAEDFGSDGHSHSWLSSEEITFLSKWLRSIKVKGNESPMTYDLEYSILNCYLEGNSFSGLFEYPEDKPEWIEDVRFVFWFDN